MPHDGHDGHKQHDAHHHEASADPEKQPPKKPAGGHDMHAHMHGGGDLPMFANITIAVCHCGAGCVLGDIIGEWIVFGTGITISGRDIWPEWLIG